MGGIFQKDSSHLWLDLMQLAFYPSNLLHKINIPHDMHVINNVYLSSAKVENPVAPAAWWFYPMSVQTSYGKGPHTLWAGSRAARHKLTKLLSSVLWYISYIRNLQMWSWAAS